MHSRLLGVAATASAALFSSMAGAQQAKPNIIVILADDMGYSDIGCYGGEIQTPNLDALAEDGLRFTQFYNTARCCPTRASLLTGLYPHQAGVGHMVESRPLTGYEGHLTDRSATIAQALTPAGYRCYATGKWHVAANTDPGESRPNWPIQRGFERYYGIIGGAADYFDPSTLTKQNARITAKSDDEYRTDSYYFTDAISDYTSRFIREHHQQTPDKPFFCYVAYTAAHWPLHAKPADIAKYAGKYSAGYEAIRGTRFRRQKELGLVELNCELSPQDSSWPDDAALAKWNEQCMEVYAAQVDSMDQGIGRILQTLRETGQYDNTLILYLQDNGACAESINRDPPAADAKPRKLPDGRVVRTGPGTTPGPQDTYLSYGQGWANVSNTPFREYKHWVHEGGISTPLIVHWPAGITARNEFRAQPGHLIDIMATCLDVSGAAIPKTIDDKAILPPEGRSLVPAFADQPIQRDFLFWEHEGNRALRVGNFKLVAKAPAGKWELYDISKDRSELHDLSEQMPDKRKEMIAKWVEESKRLLVTPWPWDVRNDE